ncbi:MAG: hypothetical protein ACP5RQ_02935, partial [Candidatus Micrarchaeia archaeon]
MFRSILKNKTGSKKNKEKNIKNNINKSQSAMEYLTTYGWAILIIAVVLVVLFHMGVFNTNTGPKALPGSCKVYRPNGPGTTQYIGLEGVCNDELPEDVAYFNGNTSWIPVGKDPFIINASLKAATITLWFKYEGPSTLSYG